MGNVRIRGRKEEALGAGGRPISRLGETVRAWRKHRGLSVTELAALLDLGENGRSYISQLEHGYIQQVGEDRLKNLANVLNIEPDDLRFHKAPPPLPQPRVSRPRFAPALSRRALVADESLKEFTDPELESGLVLRLAQKLAAHHVLLIAIRDVPAESSFLDMDGTRYKLSHIGDAELPVPQSIWRRIEELSNDGVQFGWWLLAEHRLPGAQHAFSCRSLLIGIIATEEQRGAWCVIGKWAHD